MRLELPFRRGSLKTRLILSYLVVLGIGGLVTSIVGSYIVSSTIMMQARRGVDHDLATARSIYEHQLETLELTVRFLAAGRATPESLEAARKESGFDFLRLVRAGGAAQSRVVRAALNGRAAAGAEIDGQPDLVMIAAAPVRGERGEVTGALCGGVRLNRSSTLVNQAWNLIYAGERFENREVGAVAVYQGDAPVSTTVKADAGTRATAQVREAVLEQGRAWRGRTQLGGDWYISAYDPIRNYDGRVVGMLFVGALERAYTSTRDRVILSFFGLATAGFILIIGVTYYEIRAITLPLGKMAAATRSIAAGRFDHEVEASGQGEITMLAESFNTMLKSLRQMKGDLEEWGRTLEEKVKQRTEELVAVEARAAQSERLASLGMLAAGVAHEINNPLGGILALTALALEDTAPDDPNRENLEEVLKQTQRCRDIVKGLLEFSRQSVADSEPVDVNAIIEDSLSLITKQAAFFNVQVVKEWGADLPPVMADKSQLQQVFMNIFLNAVQAMGERGTLSIATRRGRLGDVEAVISDTGRGISQEVIDRIFDPFFTTKSSGEGTGLGLSIAYGIVTKHRGTIHVESEEGRGSTFTVRLPAAVGVAEREA
jgi:two-component system NtrC family sensor kinase